MRRGGKRQGPPSWFDHKNKRECDHDMGATRVKFAIGYSDSGFGRMKCNHPDCDETWDYYIEG